MSLRGSKQTIFISLFLCGGGGRADQKYTNTLKLYLIQMSLVQSCRHPRVRDLARARWCVIPLLQFLQYRFPFPYPWAEA